MTEHSCVTVYILCLQHMAQRDWVFVRLLLAHGILQSGPMVVLNLLVMLVTQYVQLHLSQMENPNTITLFQFKSQRYFQC